MSRPTPGKRQQVRIIGGAYRGRPIHFPELPGLRPTASRTRERLFNWLGPYLPGARLLDLFAGSGALGWEGLSRGASSCCFVDAQAAVSRQLAQQRQQFGCPAEQASILQSDWRNAVQQLQQDGACYDVVFLDPPFATDELQHCVNWLQQHTDSLCSTQAWLYLEYAAGTSLPVPPSWQRHREGKSRHSHYQLWRRQP